MRKEPRKHFKGHIFYATEHQLYEGEVKNFSATGIFVKTSDRFFVGQEVTLDLPYSKGKNSKRLGEVVWQNREGIGVKLISKRKRPSQRSNIERSKKDKGETKQKPKG